MHCWKTINIEREYGTGRLVLLAITLFVLVFCFSYIAFSFNFKHFMPVVRMRLQNGIPKKSYIFALVTPFVVINAALIAGGISFPEYAHYFSGLLAFHCCICLMDFLYV